MSPLQNEGIHEAQAINRSQEQATGAMQRLETAAIAAGRLVESLNAASVRFEGVDKNLAATLKELQNGLTVFTREVSGFVSQTDQNLAKAATHLQSLVKGLQETLDDRLERV